jgi:hypothetical protein
LFRKQKGKVLERLKSLKGYDPDRYNQVKKTPGFKEEIHLLNNEKNLNYYKHIIQNVQIKTNTKNSYILWIFRKVDDIDIKKMPLITKGVRQLPDIDIDVPKFKRQQIFAYLQDKYGHDSVAQMVTFAALQGRSALTAALKFNDSCSFTEIKEITELLPMKDKVSDQMETSGEHSLIRWTLEFLPERLADYARFEDGKIVGDYANEFEQAIRLEKVKVDTSKHASAIIVYSGKIKDVCPMIKDKSSDELITHFSMEHGEAAGLVKLDLLGLACLDKLMLINELLKEKENNKKKK